MKKLFITAAFFLLAGYWLGGIVQASAPLPGGPDDPVVTKSYVDKVLSGGQGDIIEQIGYLQQQVSSLEAKVAELKQKVRIRIVLTLGSKTAYLDSQSKEMRVAPITKDGRTMLPFRFVGEALGAEVLWLPEENSVAYRLKGKEIKLKIDSTKGWVDGQPIKLDVPPVLLQGSTMVPVRIISEHLGAVVNWNDALQQITIIPEI